jgi:hypothetical protein
MATLNLVILTTGESFEAQDIDFEEVTPREILNSEVLGLPVAQDGQKWQLLKGSLVVDQEKTLAQIGFKDGDEAYITAKVNGA